MFNLKDRLTIEDTRDKIIFWDIDGTLAPYRFNNMIDDPNGSEYQQFVKEIEEGIFLKRKPSRFMQEVLRTCEAKECIIMGHVQSQKEIDDKHIWLDEHYPMFKTRLFISVQESKAEKILKYCKENNIDLSEVLYIDDVLLYLREAERKGIEAWHISSILDWFYN